MMQGTGRKIRLFISDIDGTLVSGNKLLTEETVQAARRLKKAGVQLCLVSSRFARGMRMYFEPLAIHTPFAALNGGEILDRDGNILISNGIEASLVVRICDFLRHHQVETWLFGTEGWMVFTKESRFVAREEKIVRFSPKVINGIEPHAQGIVKLMGIFEDPALLDRLGREIGRNYAGQVVAMRASEHYLDIVNPVANKGFAVQELARLLKIPLQETACIGDMDNDIPMLKIAGMSIAMGQAAQNVQQHAHYVTKMDTENGWAYAVDHFILT